MLIIGLHMTAGHEQTRRQIDGVLQYVAVCPELRVADFCYPGDDPDLSEPPPWIGMANGVIVCMRHLPGTVPWLRRGRVPVVALGGDLRRSMVCVLTSPRSLAKMAVEHFLRLGLRHFAYVGYRHADGSRDRCRALARELAGYDLSLESYETEKPLSGTYKDFAGLDKVEPELVRLLRDAAKPLAVMAINDRFAAAVCHIARALGLSIPDEVAVLGVQDYEIARVSNPPISSIRLATEQAGCEAARLVHQILRHERPKRRTVQVRALELVERESTIGKQRAAGTDIERALDFIRQKACEAIRIEHVAAHVGVPLRTFEIQFAAATGHTVGAELRAARLARVKHLLETTDLPLASVARLAGMHSPSALNEFFRRWTGATPAKYRKEQRTRK